MKIGKSTDENSYWRILILAKSVAREWGRDYMVQCLPLWGLNSMNKNTMINNLKIFIFSWIFVCISYIYEYHIHTLLKWSTQEQLNAVLHWKISVGLKLNYNLCCFYVQYLRDTECFEPEFAIFPTMTPTNKKKKTWKIIVTGKKNSLLVKYLPETFTSTGGNCCIKKKKIK